jgi:hypothetical protein
VNRNGYPQTLQAVQPENTNAAKTGIYSARLREPRAQEIAEQIMAAPWAAEHLDEHGAVEIARVESMIESLDAAIAAARGNARRDYFKLRLAASRELRSWLSSFGLLPRERADWTAKLQNKTAAELIRQRFAELDGGER